MAEARRVEIGGGGAPWSAAGTLLDAGIRAGDTEIRLARSEAEIREAQRLRFRIFYQEMTARPTPEMQEEGRDFDRFDAHCDHLLVLDHSDAEAGPRIVGTYRLMRRAVAVRNEGFYTATEFDISRLMRVPGEILEVGRACVAPAFRTRPTMQLLWRGIATYSVAHGVKIMFGCGSLPGTDPQALARPLSYLHHNHLAPEEFRARALPDRYVRTDLLPAREVDEDAAMADLDARAVLSALPPLIKGYLRLGGYIGDGAVIDRDFGTTDVCIIVVTDLMAQKYFKHYLQD
jgi:putative hemolysin